MCCAMSHPTSHPTEPEEIQASNVVKLAPARKRHPRAKSESDRNHHLQNRAGWWYFVMEWRGKRIKKSCATTDVAMARVLRDQWMEEVWREGMLPDDGPVERPTVKRVFDVFEAGPLESSAEHRRRVVNIVRSMLKAGFPGRDVDTLEWDIAFCDATVGAWRRDWLVNVQAVEQSEGQAGGARRKATGNSMLNQAAALFSTQAEQLYTDHGLSISGEAWRASCRTRGFKVASARSRFVAPPAATVMKILQSIPTLLEKAPVQGPTDNTTPPDVQRRNMLLAVALMLGGGLRKGEVSQVQWSWIADHGQDWLIDGAADVKDGGGRLRQRVLAWVLELARVRGLRGDKTGPVLEGHETERNEMVFRRVSDWMRGLGWEARKTSHGLRDLAISCIIAETGSAWEGQGFARHSSVTVTEAHYGHFAREEWLRDMVAGVKAIAAAVRNAKN